MVAKALSQNPSHRLYQLNEPVILETRESTWDKFNNVPEIRSDLKKSFEKRLSKGLPMLGEIYPWLISEMLNIDKNVRSDIAKSWFCIYLYTLFVDDMTDRGDYKNLFGLTRIFKDGVVGLHRYVVGSKFESQFETALNQSLEYGYMESQLQKNLEVSQSERIKYTKGKNDLIDICCLALINASNEDSVKVNKIKKLTEELKLVFQLLDDIADIEEDFESHNSTYVISPVLKRDIDFSITKEELLKKLILDDSFSNLFNNLSSSLETIISLSKPLDNSGHLTSYFADIKTGIDDVSTFLKKARKKSLIDDNDVTALTLKLNIFAQST